jgi:arylsulfatase A-like enzyme
MEPLGQTDLTFDKARDWLRAHRDKRFFLFLHTFQVHDPYSPPPAYADLFAPDADLAGDAKRPQRESVLYDREIRYTDDHLKALFQTLAELDLDERTIFLVTSDHGEEFFEHGLWGHGGTLYQEVSHVPFMAWGPGLAKGKRVAGPVGHIDLMPTILGLANVPPPPQVLGIDLSATLRDPDAHPVTNRPLFSEAWAEVGHGVGYELVKFERPGYMVQVGTEKLMRIRRQGQPVYERYDLASDPAERRNLYVEGAPDPLGLRAAVDGYEATCAQLAEHLRQQAGGSKDSPAKVQLSPEQEEKLRALGYLH